MYIKNKNIIIEGEGYRYILSILDEHSISVLYQEMHYDNSTKVEAWKDISNTSYTIDILPIFCESLLELGKFYADEKNYIFS